MRTVWSAEALEGIEALGEPIGATVRSEADVMFLDSIPGGAAVPPSGALMVELPCGVEVSFERIGDDVRIVHVDG